MQGAQCLSHIGIRVDFQMISLFFCAMEQILGVVSGLLYDLLRTLLGRCQQALAF